MAEEPEWTEAGLRKIKPTGKREVYPDPTSPGLVLLMTPAGVKTFYLVYRAGGGRAGKRRWFKLGRFGVDGGLGWARGRATTERGKIQEGADPQAARKTKRADKSPTVADLADRWESTWKVQESTAKGYKQILTAHIRPVLGKLKVREVRPTHITALLDAIPTEGQRDHVRAAASRLFSRAVLWEMREGNPAQGQDRATPKHREVRLTNEQIRDLGLKGSWQFIAMVRLLLLTGMRVSELVGNRALTIPARTWADVDTVDRVIRLKRHKTMKMGIRTVYLCPQAVTLLDALPRENDLVLAGWRNPQHSWERFRAGTLDGVNLHDLRHTFASIGEDLGYSEATIAALLGHSAGTQTGRYTHKLSKDLTAAADAIGGHIAGLLGL